MTNNNTTKGKTMKYPVGTTFTPRRKNTYTATVIDYHTTTNLAGEVIKARYVCTHDFCGKTVTDYDVSPTTIARGEPKPPSN